VLRSSHVPKTRRGRWFLIFAVAFFLAWLFGSNAVLLSLEPPDQGSRAWLRTALIGIAAIPIVIAYISFFRFRLGRALGLIQSIPTQAVLDPSGIELSLDGSAPEIHRWEEIVAMEKVGDDWRLVGPDGSTVVPIPSGLAVPSASWFDAPTLAEAIVDMRPDRYSLRGDRFELGPDELGLRRPGDPVGRVRTVIHMRVLGLGVVMFVVALILLFWVLPQPR
jgi:hypothetical protein